MQKAALCDIKLPPENVSSKMELAAITTLGTNEDIKKMTQTPTWMIKQHRSSLSGGTPTDSLTFANNARIQTTPPFSAKHCEQVEIIIGKYNSDAGNIIMNTRGYQTNKILATLDAQYNRRYSFIGGIAGINKIQNWCHENMTYEEMVTKAHNEGYNPLTDSRW